MDHEVVVRQKVTERYLLNELDADERDAFEEHYFVCTDCARDVQAASEFVEHSRVVLSEASPREESQPVLHLGPARHKQGGWLAWLRPSLAVPVMALLLAVVGYQNLVTLPTLRSGAAQPRVLPWAAVAVGTWGDATSSLKINQGSGFLLFVRIPPDGAYPRYRATLYNPGGDVEWSVAIPANAGQDQYPLQIPGKDRVAGTYKLRVSGVTPSGESKDLGNASFELQIQKP